jgi:hypothetical protein
MTAPHDESQFRPPPRCARCGDVIGVYERLVRVTGALARSSSRAAEPGICRSGGACYHFECYEPSADAAQS